MRSFTITCCIIFMMLPFTFNGQIENTNKDSIDIWSLSIDELINMEVVSAQKTERKLNRTPASVIVITRKEIEKYGYTSLQEILNQVPGLYLWDSYHVRGRIDIGVRGNSSCDNIIILVNGVNQVEGVYNEYLLTKVAVPVDAIDRIEVVRGPMSVLYGSGAFFGVINIITNDINEKSKHSSSLLYGSNNYLQGTIRTFINSKEIKFGLTASGYRTDGMNQPYKDMMTNPDLLTNWGLERESTTKGILLDKSAYFNMTLQYKGLSADITHTNAERGGFLVQPPIEYSPMKRHSTNVMASYQHEFNDKIKVIGKFSYLTTNSLAFYSLNEKGSYLSFGYNSDAFEIEALSFFKLTPKFDITLGLFHRNIFHATNPAELTGAWGIPYGMHLSKLASDSRIIENSVYTQLDYSISKKLELIGGLRIQQMPPYKYEVSGGPPYVSQGRQVYTDTYKSEKQYFIPSLALLYMINDDHIVKLLYGEALRNPPLGIIADILFSTSDDQTFDYPQLIPSNIRTFEINYNGLIGSRFSTHISIFRNELKNLISQYFLNLTDSVTVYYSSNKGEILTHGIEASFTYNPFNNLTLSASCMYQRSEDMTKGIEKVDVAYSPEYLGYFKLTYTIYKNYTFFVNGKYVSPILTEYDLRKKKRLGNETPPYTEVNAGVIIKNIIFKGLELKLNVKNLTNSKIYYPVSTLNQFADKGLLGFQRRFFIGLKYEF